MSQADVAGGLAALDGRQHVLTGDGSLLLPPGLDAAAHAAMQASVQRTDGIMNPGKVLKA